MTGEEDTGEIETVVEEAITVEEEGDMTEIGTIVAEGKCVFSSRRIDIIVLELELILVMLQSPPRRYDDRYDDRRGGGRSRSRSPFYNRRSRSRSPPRRYRDDNKGRNNNRDNSPHNGSRDRDARGYR